MTSKWQWFLRQFSRRLWVRISVFAALAIATALLAIVLEPYVPEPLLGKVGTEAVDHILDILASSMLAVTTFSLSVMVAAYGAATSNVTPRATQLLMADTTTQNVLGTFIGSFLFSLVGIIALSTGLYGEGGRVVLFAVTLVVITLIVLMLLRWIDHLSRLGRVGATTNRVEQVTLAAIRERVEHPYLGGQPLKDRARDQPRSARPVYAKRIGYVQHVDIGVLEGCAKSGGGKVYVEALPGTFVHESRPVCWADAAIAADRDDDITAAFTIGEERSFDQDPRFGVSVLAEIASRALSPGINDPGTAIDVIGRLVRILTEWREVGATSDADKRFPSVHVPPILTDELFDDAFTPIARDGAGTVEVQVRLQKALIALAVVGGDMRRSAGRHSRLALKRAEAAMALPEDVQALQTLSARIA